MRPAHSVPYAHRARPFVLLVVALALLLGPVAPAAATTGGPVEVEVLGLDPQDASIYYLEHDGGEGLETPTLFRLPTAEPRPRVAERLAWDGSYADATDWRERWRAEETRLSAIAGRLVPLIALPTSDVSVELECPPGAHARGHLHGSAIVPRPIRLDLVRGCEARVLALSLVPGTTDAIAVVRYLGVAVEGGYDRDRVVLVRHRVPRAAAAQPEHPSPRAEVRARLEAVYASADDTPSRLDLVVLDDAGRTRSLTVTRAPGECFVDSSPFVVRCTGAGELRLVRRARVVDVVREGHVVARATLPPGLPPVLTFAVATEVPVLASPDVRAICATDWDCRVLIDGTTVLYEPMRGRLACTDDGPQLRCTWSHTTRIDMVRRHCIDVSRRRVTRC